jgi:hypothetical protein
MKKPSEKQKFERTMSALFRVPKSVGGQKVMKKSRKGKD